MTHKPIGRKEFLATLGKGGAGLCACAAAKPGDKTAERAVKRMELVDSVLRGGKRCKFRMTVA